MEKRGPSYTLGGNISWCSYYNENRMESPSENMKTRKYENAKLFKEKVKRWHDKRIQKYEFKVGENVLLYNSHFK